jgi:hypothetical protein
MNRTTAIRTAAIRTVLAVAFAMSVIACNDAPDVVPGPSGEVFVAAPSVRGAPIDSLEAGDGLPSLRPEAPALDGSELPLLPEAEDVPLTPEARPLDPAGPRTPEPGPQTSPETAPETAPEGSPDAPRTSPPAEEAPASPGPVHLAPVFEDIRLVPGMTFAYQWVLTLPEETIEGVMLLTLGEGVSVAAEELGGNPVTMYPVEMSGDIAPGFRRHQALGAQDDMLFGGRVRQDGELEARVIFAFHEGYVVEQGFSAMMPLVEQPEFAKRDLHDDRGRYFGAEVWSAETAVERYGSGVGFTGLDLAGMLLDADGNETPGHLHMALLGTDMAR